MLLMRARSCRLNNFAGAGDVDFASAAAAVGSLSIALALLRVLRPLQYCLHSYVAGVDGFAKFDDDETL